MKARRSAASRRAPQSVWLAVFACGAFHCSRDANGAAHAGRSHQDVCCSQGGHPFAVIEYLRQEASLALPPVQAAETRMEPLRLPVLMRRLEKRVEGCTRCALATTRQHTVFARGNPEASVCFVGEAPGADEDAQGRPFVGRAGRLLDTMIEQMGLSPEKDVYICNIIKCRPPDNRRPTPGEIDACSSHLHEQLSLWTRSAEQAASQSVVSTPSKRIIVAMGKTAIATLLDTKTAVTKLRGQWKLYRGRVMLMPTYHPSFLLRPFKTQAQSKMEAASDLLLVAKELGLEPRTRTTRRPKLYAISGGLNADKEKGE